MGASHTEIFGAVAALPPLDSTLWPHPAMVLRASTTLTATST
jgi:hypothetical protein